MKDKDSAINDVNEKLMKRMNECQVLREENAAARESLHLSTDREVKHIFYADGIWVLVGVTIFRLLGLGLGFGFGKDQD